ncbi:MAG TPA: DUF721 domain-containing protein [Gallionellaceae bacterium]
MPRLNSFFTGNPELRGLAQKAGQLAALEQLYRKAIPPALAEYSRVIGFERHTLVIGADNNAIAAKLRHLTPHVLKKVQESSVEVTGILIKVQVSQPAKPPGTGVPGLSHAGRQQLTDLAANLHDSPLKRALLRLIKR